MSERSELLDLVIEETDEKMRKAVDHARAEFASVRTGRASSALIERLTVEAYDSTMPLQQLASFKVPEARMLMVIPFDKGTMPAIEKAIRNSDLGLNPSNDGSVIRLVFPQLTEERRKELVKRVRHQAEEGKVSLRNLRRGARHEFDTLVKDGDATEDEAARAEKELDKLTHSHEAQIDQALENKEHELLEV
jgi:ribosome recycling factor